MPAMAERTGGDVLFQFHPRKPATGMATTRAGQGSMTPSDLPLHHVGARRGFQVCRNAGPEPCRPASCCCATPFVISLATASGESALTLILGH